MLLKCWDNTRKSIVIDTGAYVTIINKSTADNNKYPIIAKNALMLYGFIGKGIIKREIIKSGKDIDNTINEGFHLNPLEAKRILEHNNLHNVGMLCDLRIIPVVVLSGIIIENVVVATPAEDDTDITEVLGMNVLGYFRFGIDLDSRKIYLSRKDGGYEPPDSRYKCGRITLAPPLPTDNAF
jgi:hypothetical protein